MIAALLLAVSILGMMMYSNLDATEKMMDEQQTEIETLQDVNAELIEENKQLSAEYSALRDEYWNWSQKMERESVE